MGFEDVFADEMLGKGPKFFEEIFSPMFQRTHIVDERVEPYVSYVTPIERDFDAPGETALGTGDAQIADRFAQHRNHFILEAFGSDEVGMLFQVAQKPVLVFPNAKKIFLLLDKPRPGPVIRALSVH